MIQRQLVLVSAVLIPATCLFWYQHSQLLERKTDNARLAIHLADLRRDVEARRTAPGTHAVLDPTPATERHLPAGIPAGDSRRAPLEPRDARSDLAHRAHPTGAATVALSKTNLARLALAPLTSAYRVTDEAAAVLGLSTAEREAVDSSLAQVVSQHEKLDLARAIVSEEHLTSEPGRKTTFTVAAYPQEGKVLAQNLLTAMHQAIGSNRTQLLLGYADMDSISADGFEPFGRAAKTITFLDQFTPDGARGDCRILMKIVDSITGITLTTGFVNRDDTIPPNWRHLIQNLAPAP